MALDQDQLNALAALPLRPSGLMFEPTLMPSHYTPLLALGRADADDLVTYGAERGWTDLEVGCILGAARLLNLMAMSGGSGWTDLIERRPSAES